MTKKDAIKRANDLGYSISYHESDDEVRFRKSGAAVNSLNMPYEFCRVYRDKRSWLFEEKVDSLIL